MVFDAQMALRMAFRRFKMALVSFFDFPPVYYSLFLRPFPSFNLGINRILRSFYSFSASVHPQLRRLYVSSSTLHRQVQSGQVSLSDLEAVSVLDLTEKALNYGASFLPQALTPASVATLKLEIEKASLTSSIPFGDGVSCDNKVLCQSVSELDLLISKVSKDLIGKKIKPACQAYQLLKFDGEVDVNDSNTLQHVDRYLPCLKMFYFPDSVSSKQSPFAYVPFSHLIDADYLKSIDHAHQAICRQRKFSAPFSVERRVPLPDELHFVVPENTLVVAFTNGIHRRSEFAESVDANLRYRKSLRFIFYRSFGLLDLVFPSVAKVFDELGIWFSSP